VLAALTGKSFAAFGKSKAARVRLRAADRSIALSNVIPAKAGSHNHRP
jgi:hypothetical protein